MTRTVELITDKECPNVGAAREQLEQACAAVGTPAEWQEWDRENPDAPKYVKQYGSPTILVDGCDVAGNGTESHSHCCRIYQTEIGVQGVPSVEMITAALERSEP